MGSLLYPHDQLAVFSSLLERFKPVGFIVFGLSSNYLIWATLQKYPFGIGLLKKYILVNRRQFIFTGLVFGILCLTWIFISVTRLGILPDLFWKVAGVPLLSFQLYLIGGYVLFILVTTKYVLTPNLSNSTIKPAVIDVILFLIIWLIGSAIWTSIPQERSVFAPGPYPPANVFYPHSDAAVHDAGGTLLALGLPLNNGNFTDKPAYMFFLGLVHLIFGDDPNQIVNVQTIFLALFPAILYLLGKEIYDRNLGLCIAMISIARAGNAISAVTEITTTSVKELMSEMPLALALALFCLVLIRYTKNKEKDIYPICIGGLYGITILIRPHPLLFAPILVFIVLLLHRKQKPVLLKHTALFLFSVF